MPPISCPTVIVSTARVLWFFRRVARRVRVSGRIAVNRDSNVENCRAFARTESIYMARKKYGSGQGKHGLFLVTRRGLAKQGANSMSQAEGRERADGEGRVGQGRGLAFRGKELGGSSVVMMDIRKQL